MGIPRLTMRGHWTDTPSTAAGPEPVTWTWLLCRPEARPVDWHWITVRFDIQNNSTHPFDFCSICDTNTGSISVSSQTRTLLSYGSFVFVYQLYTHTHTHTEADCHSFRRCITAPGQPLRWGGLLLLLNPPVAFGSIWPDSMFNPPVTFIFTDIFYPWGQYDPSY